MTEIAININTQPVNGNSDRDMLRLSQKVILRWQQSPFQESSRALAMSINMQVSEDHGVTHQSEGINNLFASSRHCIAPTRVWPKLPQNKSDLLWMGQHTVFLIFRIALTAPLLEYVKEN